MPLGDNLRIELSVAITRGFQVYFSEVSAYGFRRATVPGVAASTAFARVFAVAELLFHLEFQEGFQGLFDQILEHVLAIHGTGSPASADLGYQCFLERFWVLVQRFGIQREAGVAGRLTLWRFFHGDPSFRFRTVTGWLHRIRLE